MPEIYLHWNFSVDGCSWGIQIFNQLIVAQAAFIFAEEGVGKNIDIKVGDPIVSKNETHFSLQYQQRTL